jgi:hypothetical protein
MRRHWGLLAQFRWGDMADCVLAPRQGRHAGHMVGQLKRDVRSDWVHSFLALPGAVESGFSHTGLTHRP